MEELKRLRTERGYSQRRLADLAGLDQSAISEIEAGKRSPSVNTLERLVKAMDAEMADLFPKSQASLFEEAGQQRSADLDAWTSYLLRRAEEWEKILPKSALSIRFRFPSPTQGLEALESELRADAQLASKVLGHNRYVQAEATVLLEAALYRVEAIWRSVRQRNAPWRKRDDATDFRRAFGRAAEAAEKWDIAEKIARKIVGEEDTSHVAQERAGATVERLAEERRKVVALFGERQSA